MEIEFAQLTAQKNVQKVSENKVADVSEQKQNNEEENFTDILHAIIEAVKSGDAAGAEGKDLGLGKQDDESKGTEKGTEVVKGLKGIEKGELLFSKLSRVLLQAKESKEAIQTGHEQQRSETELRVKGSGEGTDTAPLTAIETGEGKGIAKIVRSIELSLNTDQVKSSTGEAFENGKVAKKSVLVSAESFTGSTGPENGKENVVIIQTGDLNKIAKKLSRKGTTEEAKNLLSKGKRGTISIIDGRKAGDKETAKGSNLAPVTRDADKTAFQKEFAAKEAAVDELQTAVDRKDGFFSMKTAENQSFRTNTQTSLSAQDQSSLLKYLRETGNGEIVKQASIILKNENSGEIHLMLKPERLGNIRITLNLQDNNIGGRIIVENINVKEAFEHNLESLYRAFRHEGFETAGLDVSVGNQQKGEERREMNKPTTVPTTVDRAEGHSAETGYSMLDYEGNINLVV